MKKRYIPVLSAVALIIVMVLLVLVTCIPAISMALPTLAGLIKQRPAMQEERDV